MNHRRVLGWLFAAWAVFQIGMMALVWTTSSVQPSPWWAISAVVAAIYGWAAWRLLRTDTPAWILTLGLSLAALFSFPFGTIIGAYGLWLSLAKREQLGGPYRLTGARERSV